MHGRRPSGGILIELHAEHGRRMIDAGRPAHLIAIRYIPHRKVCRVLIHGLVAAQIDPEIIDREHVTRIPDPL